jgi:1-acyl-sn-glycerol-3-phosphate acyltransferase
VHWVYVAVGGLAALVILVVALPLQALLWLVSRPFDRNRAVPGRFLRFVGVALGACYPPWRFRVEGGWPAGGPFVVVSNHQSMLDIVLLSRVPHEMKWVAKEVLWKVPWVGWLLRLSGDIPVRRGDRESGGEAVERARAYLASGMSVMLFPEGTRSRDGRLLPFKSGAFRLAVDAGVPVLPIVVSGTGAGLAKGGAAVRPCDAVARLLPPVATAGLGAADVPRLRDRVRQAMAAALPGGAAPGAAAADDEEGLAP